MIVPVITMKKDDYEVVVNVADRPLYESKGFEAVSNVQDARAMGNKQPDPAKVPPPNPADPKQPDTVDTGAKAPAPGPADK